jgi:hypothetical protein
VNVAQTLTSISVTPLGTSITPGATQTFTATGRDQFAENISSPPSVVWQTSGGTISTAGVLTAPADAGQVTIRATAGTIIGTATATIRLVATNPQFVNSTLPHRVTVDFNGNLGSSLVAADVMLTHLDMNTPIATQDLAVEFDAVTRRATISYVPGVLPDGNYELTLPADSVAATSGPALDAALTVPFRFLLGDLNDSGSVDFPDLLVVAQNFGQSATTYQQGDLDYNGVVNFGDLLILTQRYAPAPARAERSQAAGHRSVLQEA